MESAMRSLSAACLSLFLALIAGNASAQGLSGGPTTVTVDIGGVKVALAPPAGHCVKDRSNPADRELIENVERAVAGQNRMLLGFAECGQLEELRERKRSALDNFGQYMTPLSHERQVLNMTHAQYVAEMGRVFRQQGLTMWTAQESDVKQRLEGAVAGLKLGETKMLGVLKSDARAVYIGVVLPVRLPDGSDKRLVGVFSTGLVKGKMINLNVYRDMDALGGHVVDKTAEQNSATRTALNAANGN
jgi:hypothetical protein